jgi:nucleoporin NDC1
MDRCGEVRIKYGFHVALRELTIARYHERIRLNERPIYLRFLFLCLAVAQSVVHLVSDYDRIVFPVLKANRDTGGPNISSVEPAAAQLKQGWPRLLERSAKTTFIVVFVGSFLYFIFLRLTLWDWYFAVARHAFSLGRSAKPGGVHLPTLIMKFVFEGFLLVSLWRFTNKAFDAYVGQEPLKNGKPITDDSKDPNGSLINGLKAKKEVPRVRLFNPCFRVHR